MFYNLCQGLLRLVILNIRVVLMEVKNHLFGEEKKSLSRGGLESVMNVDVWECTVFTVVVGS